MKHLKLCLILMFTSSLLSGCHTASLPQKEISQTVAPIAALEVAGAIPSEKIAWFNSDYFNVDGKDEMCNMMLSSVYKDVREIDLYKLFYNGIPETCNDICDEEKKILSAIDAGAEHLDIIKITSLQMNNILQTYADIEIDQTEKYNLDKLIYLERYDAYYMIHGDCIDTRCEVISGTQTEDGYLILQYWMNGERYEVTLKENENNFLFVSNMLLDERSTPKNET